MKSAGGNDALIYERSTGEGTLNVFSHLRLNQVRQASQADVVDLIRNAQSLRKLDRTSFWDSELSTECLSRMILSPKSALPAESWWHHRGNLISMISSVIPSKKGLNQRANSICSKLLRLWCSFPFHGWCFLIDWCRITIDCSCILLPKPRPLKNLQLQLSNCC